MVHIDASAFLRNLATIERRVLDAARVGMDRAVKVAYRSAHETTLFKDRTGRMRGEMDIIDQGAYSKRLIFRAPYSKWVNDGTKPHVIVPKNGPFLRFVIGGRVIFARKVKHPGTTRRPVLENAAAAGSQAMSVMMTEGAENAVNYP